MPMAKQKSATGLSIELHDNRKYYTVGSTVTGNVSLDTAQDFAIGSVNIEFYGRVKVYFVHSHGQGESQWRGRAPLFSQSANLYEGYHTHKPGSFSWPFSFQIPTNPDIEAIRLSKHQWKEKIPYLSTEDYIPSHPMPPSFDMWKFGFGYRWHIFVEYVVKVEVKEADGARMVLPPSSRKATLPITVKHVARDDANIQPLPLAVQFSLPEQLSDKLNLNAPRPDVPNLKEQTFRETVRSSKLLTWNKPVSPNHARSSSFSLLERTKQVLKSNSLPRYTFEMSVSVPETIPLLQEGAIPFIVQASPVRDNENTTIQAQEYPDIHIDNLSISLVATTYLRCKTPFPPRPCSYDIKLLDHHPVDHTLSMNAYTRNESFALNPDSSANPHPENLLASNSIDLSKLPGVSTTVGPAKLGSKRVENPLTISFNTYILARSYKLKWKLELDVAGEKVKIQNEADIPVQILPAEAEKLDALMKQTEVADSQQQEAGIGNEDEGDESADESTEAPSSTSSKKPLSGFLARRKGKRSKEEEAAEDRERESDRADANASADFVGAPFSSSLLTGSRSTPQHHDDALPRYEQTTTGASSAAGSSSVGGGFGYRHEIDEGPPVYQRD